MISVGIDAAELARVQRCYFIVRILANSATKIRYGVSLQDARALDVLHIFGFGAHRLTWQDDALGPEGPRENRRGPVAPVFGVSLENASRQGRMRSAGATNLVASDNMGHVVA